jgi:hypothetical protein
MAKVSEVLLAEARQRNRAGCSNFGVMRDGARKEIKKLKKTGFSHHQSAARKRPIFHVTVL